MRRIVRLSFALLVGWGIVTAIQVKAQDDTGYAPVNGLAMYYEVYGEGDPLVLIHGGLGGIIEFGQLIPVLSQTRQIIAVERQGHGRTADIDRPLSYETLADDIAALIDYLGYEQADVMGFSLGGGVALQTAIRHPESVRNLVLISTPSARSGIHPEFRMGMEGYWHHKR
jgi:pimeloyl-ACP methyl ester carboxylesterase